MTFNPGDKIFAKVKGYPHWPCRINPLPEGVNIPKGKYPIFFYGTHEVYFLAKKDIFPYDKNVEKFSNKSNKSSFLEGLKEIQENPDILCYGKDPEAEEFLLQFYDFDSTLTTENKSEENTEAESEQQPNNIAKRRKIKPSEVVVSNKENEEVITPPLDLKPEPKKLNALGRPVRKSASNFSAKKMILGNDFDFEPESSTVPVKDDNSVIAKSSDDKETSIKTDEAGKNNDTKFDESEEKHYDDDFIVDDEKTLANKPVKNRSNSKAKKKDLASAIKEAKAENQKRNASVYKNEPVVDSMSPPLEKKKKLNGNLIEECKDLEKETKLMMLDRGIKSCLVLNQENFSACLGFMKQLEMLQVPLLSLARCYSIVLTIKKCRRYTRSTEIKLIAQQIFNNFLEIFTTASKNQITEADRELKKRTESVIKAGKLKDIPRNITELFSFQKSLNIPATPNSDKITPPLKEGSLLASPNCEMAKKDADTSLNDLTESEVTKENKKPEVSQTPNVMEAIKKAFIRQVQTKSPCDVENSAINSDKNKEDGRPAEEIHLEMEGHDEKIREKETHSTNGANDSVEDPNLSNSSEKAEQVVEPVEEKDSVQYHRPPSPLDEELQPKSPKSPFLEDCINPEPNSSLVESGDSVVDRKRDRSPHALPHPLKHYKRCFLQALGYDSKEEAKDTSKNEHQPRKEAQLRKNQTIENVAPAPEHLDLDSRIAGLFPMDSKSFDKENDSKSNPRIDDSSMNNINSENISSNDQIPPPPPPPPIQNSNLVLKAKPIISQVIHSNGTTFLSSSSCESRLYNPPLSPEEEDTNRVQNLIQAIPITPASPPRSSLNPNDILNFLQKKSEPPVEDDIVENKLSPEHVQLNGYEETEEQKLPTDQTEENNEINANEGIDPSPEISAYLDDKLSEN